MARDLQLVAMRFRFPGYFLTYFLVFGVLILAKYFLELHFVESLWGKDVLGAIVSELAVVNWLQLFALAVLLLAAHFEIEKSYAYIRRWLTKIQLTGWCSLILYEFLICVHPEYDLSHRLGIVGKYWIITCFILVGASALLSQISGGGKSVRLKGAKSLRDPDVVLFFLWLVGPAIALIAYTLLSHKEPFTIIGGLSGVGGPALYLNLYTLLSIALAHAWLFVLGPAVLGVILVKHRQSKFIVRRVDVVIGQILSSDTWNGLVGAAANVFVIIWPLLARVMASKDSLVPSGFTYWGFVTAAVGFWLSPILKSLRNLDATCHDRFRRYLNRRISSAAGHTLFVGFGHLGSLICSELIKTGDLSAEYVVFPDGSVHRVLLDVIVVDCQRELFAHSIIGQTGEHYGVIRRKYPDISNVGRGKVMRYEECYVIGIAGDACHPYYLEHAGLQKAECVISTVPGHAGELGVFDNYLEY